MQQRFFRLGLTTT